MYNALAPVSLFHFNNTEIFLILCDFFLQIFVTEWKQYGDDQTVVCFRSRLLCLSVRATPERLREWERTMTGGTFSKTTPNHSLCLFLPVHQREVSQSNMSVTVSHDSLWIQQRTGAPCLVTCYLYHALFCVKSLATILKKLRSCFYATWNVPWHLFNVIRAGNLQSKEVK